MRCVPVHDFTLSKAMAWRSSIADDPPYQRKSSIWSIEKQQLFVDSLLNGYDVPKIYLHDLRGKHPTRVYAIVDGKQRLTTIWRYLTDEFPLADDFRIEVANLPDLPPDVEHPVAGQRFSQLEPAWQQVLRRTYLAVVLIQNATEEDIEDLFSRLNNGEPLNAAEKRNAMSGDAAKLVRAIADHRFFTDRARFTNARYHHHDVAARMLAVEAAIVDGAPIPSDLRSRSLDGFIRANRRLTKARRRELLQRVSGKLDRLSEVFLPKDPLLVTQAAALLHYVLIEHVTADPPDGWQTALRAELEAFGKHRRSQRRLAEDEQDPLVREFDGLPGSASNEAAGMERRAAILAHRLRERRAVLRSTLWLDRGVSGPTDPASRLDRPSHVHSKA